jgi:hypothetical protein
VGGSWQLLQRCALRVPRPPPPPADTVGRLWHALLEWQSWAVLGCWGVAALEGSDQLGCERLEIWRADFGAAGGWQQQRQQQLGQGEPAATNGGAPAPLLRCELTVVLR